MVGRPQPVQNRTFRLAGKNNPEVQTINLTHGTVFSGILVATNRHDIVVLTLVRSLRVVRVIRLATHIPGFDQILAACTYPARVLLNVFVLLAIGVYVFANIGVALFSDVEIEVDVVDTWLVLPTFFLHEVSPR